MLLVFVTGAETEEVDLSGLTVNGSAVGDETEVRAMLVTGQEQMTLEGGKVKMPGYSVMVLK